MSEALTLTKDELTTLVKSAVDESVRAINTPAPEERPAAVRSAPSFARRRYGLPRLGVAMKAAFRGGWKSSEAFEKDITQAASEIFGYRGEKTDENDPVDESLGATRNYRSIIWPKNRTEMTEVLFELGERGVGDIERIERAVRDNTEGTQYYGQELVPTQFAQDRFAYDPQSTIALRNAGVAVMPVRSNVVSLPRETAKGGASQSNEATQLSVQTPTFDDQSITIRKQYGYRKYSNELIADSDPAWNEYLARTLVRDVALQQDIQYLEGTGSAPQIYGLVAYSGVTAVSAGTNGASPDFDLFYDTQYALRLVGVEADFVISHPRLLNSLAKIKDASGNYIMSNRTGVNSPMAFGTGIPGAAPKGVILDTIPMWFSSQKSIARTVGTSSDCESVIMGAKEHVLILDRQGIEIAFSEHIYFDYDMTAARAIARSAVAILQPDAVAIISGVRA
jgi:HK97 family phage major capsid protein